MQNSYRKAESISHPHAAVAGFSGGRDHKTGSNGVANQFRYCAKNTWATITHGINIQILESDVYKFPGTIFPNSVVQGLLKGNIIPKPSSTIKIYEISIL